jgi:23S rRNA (guanine745-N1)-methyltransferase
MPEGPEAREKAAGSLPATACGSSALEAGRGLIAIRYTHLMLLCSVRGCHLELAREERRMVCPRKHSFDIARSGYINLLQPQERRAKQPGDTAEAIAARRHLHDRGFTEHQRLAISETIAATREDVVLDAGCGDGFYLGALQRDIGFDAHGIDISVPAIEAAARRYPECEWVVANADRVEPYADRSFSIVLSITARMNPPEFRRVLRDDGRLMVAIPSPDDLIELRGSGRDRVAQTVDRFSGDFTLIHQRRVSNGSDLSAADVRDVLISIYRPMQRQPVEAKRVTFSLELLLFQVR